MKNVQKQISQGGSSTSNIEANFLLGFNYNDEHDDFNQGTYYNSYGGKKGSRGKPSRQQKYRPLKDYSVQSAFKFIIRDKKQQDEQHYALNLYDQNENIEWKDVVSVIFNMINADDVQCPICMEPLQNMIVPRITKCGHIYCWPCVLQYLAYNKDPSRSWKRCPLCNDPIYKNELKNVQIVQSQYYKEGQAMTFNLMVRSKGNIIVKDKAVSESKEESKVPTKLYTS